MQPVRGTLRVLSHSGTARRLVTLLPGSSRIVRAYVPGQSLGQVADAVRSLAGDSIQATLGCLDLEATSPDDVTAAVQVGRALLAWLDDDGLADGADIGVRPSALGLRLDDGPEVALKAARSLCAAAAAVGATVTLDMEEHDLVEPTLRLAGQLRADFTGVGVTMQASLRRTEEDCRELVGEGVRVRLCKGEYDAPPEVAWRDPADVDRSFVRCLKVLMAGSGYPMVATHDERLVEIASALASRYGRAIGSYEFQMLYGVRSAEQRRLAAAGERVRAWLPYGPDWYAYLLRRLAERPRDLPMFLTSLIAKK